MYMAYNRTIKTLDFNVRLIIIALKVYLVYAGLVR